MSKGERTAILTLLVILCNAGAGSLKTIPDKVYNCARHCRVSGQRKFHYIRESTYVFNYSIDTSMFLEQFPDKATKLQFSALAHVHVFNTCEMTLRLKELRIMESNHSLTTAHLKAAENSGMLKRDLERYSLHFSFQDGRISDICPTEGDTVLALNIKRGFLSAFQTSGDKSEMISETDVSGQCMTHYTMTQHGGHSFTVQKVRHLNNCSSRHGHRSNIHFARYDTYSSGESRNLPSSQQNCQQLIDSRGILKTVICTERHNVRSIDTQSKGAVTEITQKIEFVTQKKESIFPENFIKRARLESEIADTSQDDNRKTATHTVQLQLRKLCDKTKTDLALQVPDLFWELVGHMRKMDASNLRVLYEKVSHTSFCGRSNDFVLKVVQDALAMTGTEASVRIMSKRLVNREIKGLQGDVLLTSLALLPRPTAAMLREVKALVDSKQLSGRAMLPVSGMINNYCQHHQDCNSNPDVLKLMLVFKRVVGVACYVEKTSIDQVLLGLRAIGNAGHVIRMAEVLESCLRRKHSPREVRLTALQAYRHMPCDVSRKHARLLYEDHTEDSELRIAAYLTIMKCQTPEVLHSVRSTLAGEKNTQVLSFVISHLVNRKNSTGPDGQNYSTILEHAYLSGKQAVDGEFHKSHNYAGSYTLPRSDVTVHAETNLIWPSVTSPSPSPILPMYLSVPRSVSVHVAFNVLGHTMGFMELGARGEGLEFLMEDVVSRYFGKKAARKNPAERKREMSHVQGSAYFRLLGNDLAFTRTDLQATGSITLNNLFQFLEQSADGDYRFTHNTILMDRHVIITTLSGLSLTLAVNCTASINLHASGKVDLSQITKKPQTMYLSGEIQSSGTLSIAATMSLDAMVTRTGLRMTGSVRSSTRIKGHLEASQEKLLDLELDVPEQKSEIMDMRSEFMLLHNKVVEKLVFNSTDHRNILLCTGNTTARVSGLELCGQLVFHNAPLNVVFCNVPSEVTLALHKRDTHSGYKLLAKNIKEGDALVTVFSFSTPGSSVDRTLALKFLWDRQEGRFIIGFASPWKNAEARASLSNTANLKGARGSLIIDKNVTFAIVSEFSISKSKDDNKYNLVIEFLRSDVPELTLRGVASIGNFWKSVSADVTLIGVSSYPISVKGSLTNTKKEISVRVTTSQGEKNIYSFSTGTYVTLMNKQARRVEVNYFLTIKAPSKELISVTGKGDFWPNSMFKGDVKLMVDWIYKVSVNFNVLSTLSRRKARLLNTQLTVTYDVVGLWPRDKVLAVIHLADRSTNSYKDYASRVKVESLVYPQYNSVLKIKTIHRNKLSMAELSFHYGPNSRDRANFFFFSSTLKHEIISIGKMDVSGTVITEIPSHFIDVRLKGRHTHSQRELQSNFDLTYAKGRRARLHLNFKDKSNNVLSLWGDARVESPDLDVMLTSSLTQKTKTQYEYYMNLRNKEKAKHLVESAESGVKMFRTEAEMTTKANDFLFKIKTQYGGREYGLNFVWKSSFLGQSKFIVEAFRHHQYVFVTGNSRRKQDVYKGQIRVGYEVEDKAPVILLALEGSRGRKIELEKILKWLRVRANTPGIQSSVITTDNNNRFGIKGQTAFGSKKNQLTLNFNITKPITLETFQSQWDLTTPMKDFQKVTGRISHQMHPVLAVALRDAFYALPTASQALYLLTFVDGIEELLKLIQPEPLMPQIHHSKTEERKDNVADGTGGENVLAGKDRSRDMKVGISITSNLPNVESILLNFVHKGHGQYYESDLTFEHGHQFDDTTILSPENGGVTAARSTALSSRQYGIHVSYAISSWKRNLTVIAFTPAPQGEQKSQVVSGKNGNDAIVGENADSTPRVGFLQNCNSLQDSRYNIRTHLKRNPLKSNAFAAVTLEYGIDSEQLSTYEIVKTMFPMFTSFVTSDKMVDCTGNSDDSTSCKGNVSLVISGGFRYLGHSGTDLDSICFHLLHHGYSSKHWTSSAQLGTSYFEGLDMAVNYICSDVTKTSVGIDGNDHSSDGNSIPHYVNLTFENGNSIPHYVKLTFEKSALKNMTAHLQSFSRHQYRDVSFSLIRGDESQVSEQKDGLHNAAPSGDASALKLLFDYDSGLDHFQSSIAIRCPAAEDDLWRARVHCFSLLNVNCTCYLKAPVTHIPGLNLLSRNNKTSHESIPSLTSSEHLTISSTLSSSCMQTDLSTCNAGNKTRKFSLDIVHPWSTMGAQYSLVKTGISQTEQRRLPSGDEMQERLITQSSTSTRIDDNFVEEKCFKMKAGSKSRTVEFTAKESNLPAGEKLREIGVELLSGLEKLGKILVFEMKTLGGDASNVDVKLHLPVQKIHFTTNLTETKGIKVWNSTARLASSLDNRLDWIITSQVINHKAVCSLTENGPCLYKFTVSLTQPICELDTGLSSEFSFGKSNYSASLNSWYTIQHQKRQELTWQGMVTFQVLTPANDALGNAQTTRKVPLRIEAATRYKSSGYIGQYVTKHHATDFSLDFPKRFIVYKTTSFPGQEEHLLVLEAASVNESVLVARAYRDFKRDTVPDVLLDVRLAAPTLLRVNLEWRQQTLNDLQEYLVSQLTSVDGCRSLRSYLEVIRATGSDLGSKYSAAVSSVRENADLQLKGNAIGLGNLERQLTNFIEEQVRMRTALSELVDATVRLWHGSGFDPEEVLTGLNSVWQDVSGAYDNLCVNIKHWTARLLHYAKTYPLDSFSQYFSNPQSKSQKTSPLTDTIQEQSVAHFMKSIPEPFRSQLLCVFMQTGTVIWSPGDGKLLAEICLPVPVQFLRVLPTVDDYTMTMRRAILQYVLGNWTRALDGTGSC